MSRLTKYCIDGHIAFNLNYDFICEMPDEEFKGFEEMVDKLGRYEDLEEQGRLIELPCAVGDMVWSLDLDIRWIDHFRVTDVTVTEHGIGFENPYLGYGFNVEDLGKTVFFTKEAAEAKLAEMEGAE